MPHNDIVRAFTEMGILGLGTYLWLWVALARSLFNVWHRTDGTYRTLLAAGLATVATTYFLNGLTIGCFEWPTLGWLFWSLAALPEAFRARPEA